MKCDFCDKKATVFLTQLVEGQMKKVCLCDSAPRSAESPIPPGFRSPTCCSGGMPAGKGSVTRRSSVRREMAGASARPAASPSRTCARPPLRLQRLLHDLREEVGQMVRGMHKGTSHIGKVPAGLMAMQVLHQRLEELRSRLDQAIASESYEEAAGIRDEIRNIELARQSMISSLASSVPSFPFYPMMRFSTLIKNPADWMTGGQGADIAPCSPRASASRATSAAIRFPAGPSATSAPPPST
jgi:protein arginine kinase activator